MCLIILSMFIEGNIYGQNVINMDLAKEDKRISTDYNTRGFSFNITKGPVKPTLQSLEENYKCPEWFRDVKFGIYMHWGLNTVSGFDGHYARYMYHQTAPEAYWDSRKGMSGYREGRESVYQYHVKKFGHPSKFGYKDFIPLWKAEKFDAKKLAKFYKECGAKFIGVMAVHHDNFDLYDSSYQPWNSYRMGPKIDIVRAWKDACEEVGVYFAVTSHLSNGFHENAFFQGEYDKEGPLAGVPYDTMDPANEGLYGKRTKDRLCRLNPDFAKSWYLRTKEIIDKYSPDLLYLDGGLPNGDYGLNLAAHYYNSKIDGNGIQQGVFTIKRNTPQGFTLDVERGSIEDIRDNPWLVDNTLNPGWFYLGKNMVQVKKNDDAGMVISDSTKYHSEDELVLSAGQIIDNLCDIVSKNGNMMLNVGLRADGSLPETYQHELEKIGSWLKLNGEAIYSTRPYKLYGEGPFVLPRDSKPFNDNTFVFSSDDIRFTRSKDNHTVYAIFLDWPGNSKEVLIETFKSGSENIKRVSMLGSNCLLWKQDSRGLSVVFPKSKPCKYAYVVKIELIN